MGDSSDSDPEFDKDDPYCFDPDWEDCYALASDVQGGPDEQSSSDEEDKAGDGSGATNDAEPVCVCQNCRYVTYTKSTGATIRPNIFLFFLFLLRFWIFSFCCFFILF
jgi:hypothetical protein